MIPDDAPPCVKLELHSMKALTPVNVQPAAWVEHPEGSGLPPRRQD